MKWWLGAAARLYPKAWRERYGVEFACLLDGVEPRWTDVVDVLRGAVMMQARTWSSYLKLVGAVAVAGAIVALVVSYVLPGQYVSSAVIHTGNPEDPQAWDRVQHVWQEVTSRSSLSELIQRPRLNLYPGERNRQPLEDVIERMKTKGLKIESLKDQSGAFRVSFAYPDRSKAQAVVNAVTRKVLDAEKQMSAGSAPWLVSAASSPGTLVVPNRLDFMLWGLGVGLLIGVVASFLRWRAKWTMKVAGFGLAGCAIAGGLSLLVPNQYHSRAMLRVLPMPKGDGVKRFMRAPEMADWLRKKEMEILSNESLAEIIQRPSLNLYRKQREDKPLEAVIATMRQNLKVEDPRFRGVFIISFTYPDQFKAQATVSALVTKFADSEFVVTEADLMAYQNPLSRANEDCIGKTGDAYVACILGQDSPPVAALPRRPPSELLELLDPASLPETPVAPNRWVLTGAGLFAGLFLGAYALRSKPAATFMTA